MNTFGTNSTLKIIPLVYTETQFEIYNKISRNYKHTFLFESLTGPDELAETSIMGFDPELIVKGYFDKITIEDRKGDIKTIQTDAPLDEIKKRRSNQIKHYCLHNFRNSKKNKFFTISNNP